LSSPVPPVYPRWQARKSPELESEPGMCGGSHSLTNHTLSITNHDHLRMNERMLEMRLHDMICAIGPVRFRSFGLPRHRIRCDLWKYFPESLSNFAGAILGRSDRGEVWRRI
jgi:hypothetical protein